jgi:excisionase family DNA binding protein
VSIPRRRAGYVTTNLHEAPRVDRLLTVAQVADTYGVGVSTVRRLVRQGRLFPVRLVPGGRLRFRERDVQAFIDAQADEER